MISNLKSIKLLVAGLIFILCYHFNQPAFSQEVITNKATALFPKTSDCLPPSGSAELNINNVRALINTGGDMWWDFQSSHYEIPKGSGITAQFLGSLWMGGIDQNGQLKVAAQIYRQMGNDYYTGPLTVDGTSSVTPETCLEYDKIFEIRKKEVMDFIGWWQHPGSFPGYQIPESIMNWPAHGDISQNQAYYLAPFFDNDGDGIYNPMKGDYPYFDLKNSLCKSMDAGAGNSGFLADQVIKGDQCLWWVFNDKGGPHTETQGNPLGFEIRAQAFAYATNDELNNATFYTYEIINRSPLDISNFYIGFYDDTDLGYPYDDFVGCDVSRGLGYCYNGKEVDGNINYPGSYGAIPPAIGVDFFNGIYMDADGIDNPRYDGNGQQLCNESINGSNFGDGIIDNERLGMQHFMYTYSSGAPFPNGNPTNDNQFYNILRSIWFDGTPLMYGGNGHPASASYGPACNFMFPGLSDPCHWGTNGLQPNGPEFWTEVSAGNVSYDRRFLMSSGPVSLKAGAVNYFTLGVPWARANSDGLFASVELLRITDDKMQALFDNCFSVVEGPDAPDLIVQELDKEIILYITNRKSSNNYKERYEKIDYTIPPLNYDTVASRYDSLYHFEGYQIFQVTDATVRIDDLHNPDLARIIAQCDVKNFDKNGNPISTLVNYYYSKDLNSNVAVEEVKGENKGIKHSFRIKDDMFAEGDRHLINNKQYYYLAVAYAYNNYKEYSQDIGNIEALSGQKESYKGSNKTPLGGSVFPVTAIPHNPLAENGGTIINAAYGSSPKITRIEGQGNGGNELEFTKEAIEAILSSTDHKVDHPEYTEGKGPILIKIVDPLNVKAADYMLKFTNIVSQPPPNDQSNIIINAKWKLINVTEGTTFQADTFISVGNEQLFIDEGLGFSVNIEQIPYTGDSGSVANGIIPGASTMVFTDSSRRWLTGVRDIDTKGPWNWIRSGTTIDEAHPDNNDYNLTGIAQGMALDPDEYYEKIVNGTWTPYRMSSVYDHGPAYNWAGVMHFNKLANLASVDLIITNDKSKWSRCAIVESCDDQVLAEGNAKKFDLRAAASVNINGDTGIISNDPGLNSNYISSTGMGWFPGYALNLETAERLNIVFAEDSWLSANNGRDMLWNPTSNHYTNLGEVLWGGKHFVYIMAHSNTLNPADTNTASPAYDEGLWIVNNLKSSNILRKAYVWRNAMWVTIPMAVEGESWFSNDVTIRLRVAKPYERYYSTSHTGPAITHNDNFPMYTFSTHDLATVTNNHNAAKSAMDLIKVVPNPYYAHNAYESTSNDTRVRITNLPGKCTISIYNLQGYLIRTIRKDNETHTMIDWNLKNQAERTISSGIYLFYIHSDGIGDCIIKWFGIIREQDSSSF